ncbi:MAG: fumarate hydratase [Deltaproteobacteria bacterium]|nr:fumarate hydratase [Candidatus Zymogenaceae bacterium]
MRTIPASLISERVKDLVIEANVMLPPDVVAAFESAFGREVSEAGRLVISEILENRAVAAAQRLPLCQDTGTAVFFAEIGADVHIDGGDFESAITNGMRQGYREGHFRMSMADPLTRANTGDNVPAVIHVTCVPGDGLTISFLAKGGGTENASRLFMLTPSDREDAVTARVVSVVDEAGARACPPLIVGVGLGGAFDTAPIMARRALLREVGVPHPEARIAGLESRILSAVNDLGIGPMGLGGRVTALAVHVEIAPCHIASLPLAVNLQCHSARHGEIRL